MAVKEFPIAPLPPLSTGIPQKAQADPDAASQKASEVVENWAKEFNAALDNGAANIGSLFRPDAWLRDSLTMTWDYRTLNGRDNIAAFLKENNSTARLTNIQPRKKSEGQPYSPEVVSVIQDVEWIQAMFTFETAIGSGKGVVRLVEADDNPGHHQIYIISFILQELTEHPETTHIRRPHGGSNSVRDLPPGGTWKDQYIDENPTCVIVGAGQAGLNTAARLQQLGISSLIVDKNPRIGDNWRLRYKTLVLHDPVQICHMPYLHFPPTWPLFTPKDKLADWFEAYANLLDLNVSMGTSVTSARWGEDTRTWTVRLKHSDGSVKTVQPKHFIMATGHSGEALIPRFDGQDRFKGTVYHTSQHQDAALFGDLSGKKVIVVGSGNSGHDICQNYQENGADVTILQRGPTVIMGVDKGVMPTYKGVYDDGAPPLEDADIFMFSTPWAIKFYLDSLVMTDYKKKDAALLGGLEKQGFALRPGAKGLYEQYLTIGGNYYIDVGCSQLIADGKIKAKHSQGGIKAFDTDGLILANGEKLEADIVVLATGYANMRTTARKLCGDKVADQLQDAWGLDEEGETNAMWRYSGHPGFWYMGGNLLLTRHFSRLLAMQIKAVEEGLYVRPTQA